MGQVPKRLQPESVLHFLGAEVRRLRVHLGLSQADLGAALFVHKDLIRKIESAERMPTDDMVSEFDRVLAAGGGLCWLLPLLRRERLLRAAGSTAGFRSERLDRPVLDWMLSTVHEARLAPDGTENTTAERLAQLRVTDHLRGAGPTYPDVVDVICRLGDLESQAPHLAAGCLELAGYEAVDLGDDALAQQHYLRALEIATRTGDRLYGAYLIAVSLAHLALHCGDATALHATSSARSREIEQACVWGHRAIDYAAAVASFRTAHRIVLMLAELQPFLGQIEVQAVTDYARTRLPALFSTSR